MPRTLGIFVLVVAASLSLSACSQVEGIVGDLAGQAISDATGGRVAVGELPEGWPAEVPVVEGDISGGAGVDGGWTATVQTSSASAFDDAIVALQESGFSVVADVRQDGTGVVTMTDGTYQVTLTGNSDGIIYAITPAL